MKYLSALLLALLAVSVHSLNVPHKSMTITPSTQASGSLLGVRYINSTMEIVTIDIPTGNMKTLDTKLNNKDGFMFEASSTTDGKGTYFVVLLQHNPANSQIFAISSSSGATLKQASLKGTYYLLAYDTDLDCLFGVVETMSGNTSINTLVKIDIDTFKETTVGTYPTDSAPYVGQSAYDVKNKLMYNMMITDNQYEYYYGMDVTTGKVVVSTLAPLSPTDPILFGLYCDQAKSRFVTVSEKREKGAPYTLSEIDMKAGSASQIGSTTFATENFYPTINAVSSDLRHYYAIMANTNTQSFDWYVLSIDTGAVLYHVPDYTTDPPIDLTYVLSA